MGNTGAIIGKTGWDGVQIRMRFLEVFVLFMDAGLVEIKVGNIDTAAALENMQSAFIIGLVCGLIESKIGVNVYKRAVDIIGE